MNHDQQREVIHDGGQQRGLGHVEVARSGQIGHEEGRRAHDRGHDLPAGGGHGFHRSGEGRAVAYPLHQGNGENARAVDVGRSGTGNGAEQGGGEDGDLGRTSL